MRDRHPGPEARISLTTAASRPDPSVHVAYFRHLDDWPNFHPTADVQVPAVLGDAEQVDPGAVGAAGPAGGLAIHGHRP